MKAASVSWEFPHPLTHTQMHTQPRKLLYPTRCTDPHAFTHTHTHTHTLLYNLFHPYVLRIWRCMFTHSLSMYMYTHSADQNWGILFIVFFAYFPCGVALYLVCGNVVHPWCAPDQPQSTSSVASWQQGASSSSTSINALFNGRQCIAMADKSGNILPRWAGQSFSLRIHGAERPSCEKSRFSTNLRFNCIWKGPPLWGNPGPFEISTHEMKS